MLRPNRREGRRGVSEGGGGLQVQPVKGLGRLCDAMRNMSHTLLAFKPWLHCRSALRDDKRLNEPRKSLIVFTGSYVLLRPYYWATVTGSSNIKNFSEALDGTLMGQS